MVTDKQSITNFEKKVLNTIKKYTLLNKKDKIAVAVSGGKDSTTILYILNKHYPDVIAITVDALIGSYTKKNIKNLKNFCSDKKIKLHEISFRNEFGYKLCYLISVLKSKGINLKSCTICGVLRRYLLNKYAKKLNAAKLVTGHNLDDECESIMMNFFRNTPQLSARLGPVSGVIKDKNFTPRVKPLILCTNKEVIKYSKIKNFQVSYKKCPCASDSFRYSVRTELNKLNDKIKINIVSNFLKTLPKLKQEYAAKGKINICSNCGEPTVSHECMTCKILSSLK